MDNNRQQQTKRPISYANCSIIIFDKTSSQTEKYFSMFQKLHFAQQNDKEIVRATFVNLMLPKCVIKEKKN
ncbi:hypothetical protein T12_14839 [Trichinella patagoniensis]|uniref:Uncharacterized protein n=1 Tax=Trichinella patagoniensis TaxID=990121 RepID=A0A0V0ZNZ3_9BILA|nr:hypothetical protein T12_14839 [Trichinella patagoniensis]